MDVSEVGGAEVTRAFDMNGRRVTRGHRLTREEVLAIPTRNREALVSSGQIREFPRTLVDLSTGSGERFIVRRTDLKFDVVQGVKLNVEPLTKVEAESFLAKDQRASTIGESH